jgi:hypothetical protein
LLTVIKSAVSSKIARTSPTRMRSSGAPTSLRNVIGVRCQVGRLIADRAAHTARDFAVPLEVARSLFRI